MTIVPWTRRPRDPATSGRLPRVFSSTTADASDGPLWLGRFHDGIEQVSGVELSQLEPNTLLDLQTAESRFHVVVREPACGGVLIQGGPCFPRYTAVRLCGVGLGVNDVKTCWIGLGLRVEIMWDDLRIMTAPVLIIRRRVRPAQHGLAVA